MSLLTGIIAAKWLNKMDEMFLNFYKNSPTAALKHIFWWMATVSSCQQAKTDTSSNNLGFSYREKLVILLCVLFSI